MFNKNNDKFVFLINYMNNFQEDDYLIINKNKREVNMDYPLNQILYGAPGVGKTYNTINIALEILGEDFSNYSDKTLKRKAMQERFKDYVKNGQIVFTTFHQSYGYEEFVEGIRPDINKDEMKYVVSKGIFKSLCENAKGNMELINNFDILIERLKEKSSIDLADPEKYFNIPNTKYYIQFRDGVTFRIKFDGMSDKYKDYPVNIESIREIYKNPKLGIYNSAYAKIIIEYLKTQGLKEYTENPIKKPYIIIIDEINRGNISKIFGELITLIEPSKRLGNTEELEVILPYSKERFSVPNNVYIIGTMNTADRSITTLDTALRRRFEFKKIKPASFLLSSDCDGVNLQELLNKINERIECLIGDEKLIGHSYFMDINSIDELKTVFKNKILPLLEEYFYNDYSQIKLVLNDNGMIKTKNILNTDTLYLSDDFSEVDFKKIYED
ncbi:AAA family ATPase [Campylobacter canadensis]|uniref:AAA family ATPase n=2 Tax=Campylobacter canadensis TaxID=449520 RepID=A0ABS7WTH0_9BACT|nr:AAA family ATPase [Campylobacter canadensis]MBZ7988076.1 AAA family ATPase [Campylobacter canadensis]MBZ7995523.1 AAA family ATPase [Campylobacter canadensis]MBZ7997259.1 AAA family ATPase [Campylobacter canadensis]MBZ7999047.1 AAA family ATPase [Campylobacter canadensis]MBZ8000865.1 AAA family ATPase [Campylobacter canadensis]